MSPVANVVFFPDEISTWEEVVEVSRSLRPDVIRCIFPTPHSLPAPPADCSATYYLLPITHHPLPTTYHLPPSYELLAARYHLLATGYQLPATTYCILRRTYYLVPTNQIPRTNCQPPPTTYCPLPSRYYHHLPHTACFLK
jgi:hypothetical protein